MLTGAGGGRNGEMLVKLYKVSVMQDEYVLGNLMYSMVTVVSNIVYWKFAKRVNL